MIHLSAPPELCESRNESAKKRGPDELKESQFEYEAPENPDLVLDTENMSAADCVAKVIEFLESRKAI